MAEIRRSRRLCLGVVHPSRRGAHLSPTPRGHPCSGAPRASRPVIRAQLGTRADLPHPWRRRHAGTGAGCVRSALPARRGDAEPAPPCPASRRCGCRAAGCPAAGSGTGVATPPSPCASGGTPRRCLWRDVGLKFSEHASGWLPFRARQPSGRVPKMAQVHRTLEARGAVLRFEGETGRRDFGAPEEGHIVGARQKR